MMNTAPLYVLLQLFKKDLLIFKREFGSKFFNTCCVFFTNIIVFSYFMGDIGLKDDYGPFLVVGAILSFGFYEIMSKLGSLISDIEGEKTILYTLTLPLPSWALFIYMGLFWGTASALLSILLFPLGKILLFNRFDLTVISYTKLLLIFITGHIFFGFFALWLASLIRGTGKMSSVLMRVINPLYMFGGYFYAWKSTYQLSPTIGYLNLINPMIYVMEGMRGAALGQKGYLPFWLCLGILWLFIVFCASHATYRLRRRLDCV